jgi:hypothetical protein
MSDLALPVRAGARLLYSQTPFSRGLVVFLPLLLRCFLVETGSIIMSRSLIFLPSHGLTRSLAHHIGTHMKRTLAVTPDSNRAPRQKEECSESVLVKQSPPIYPSVLVFETFSSTQNDKTKNVESTSSLLYILKYKMF